MNNKERSKKAENQAQIVLNFYKAKNFETAEIKASQLIKNYPNYAAIHNILGLSLSEQNKISEAIDAFKKLIKIRPDYFLAYNNLGNVYLKNNEKYNAEKNYIKAIEVNPKCSLALNNLGKLYKDMKKFNEAEKCFIKAIKYSHDIYVLYNNLGVLYQNLGKFNEAKIEFNKALKINSEFSVVHYHLGMIDKYKQDDSRLKQMEKIILNPSLNIENKMYLNFAIGKAYDDIKNYDKAFSFYQKGNLYKRELLNYDINIDINLFNEIKEIFNTNIFKNLNNVGNQNTSPIFIVGMPRSGSTLVEQIISSHPKVFGADEINDLNNLVLKYFNKKKKIDFPKNLLNIDKSLFKNIGDEYILAIRKYSKLSENITDKALLNFRWIGLIKLMLPNAKIIHCKRNPKDNCVSIFKNNFSGRLDFSYDLKELVQYYNLYKNLMDYWHKILPGYIHDISYENLTQNQEHETRKLLNACNLNWNQKCLEFQKNKRPVLTASISQVRKPMYRTSIKSWEKYEKHFKPFFIHLPK